MADKIIIVWHICLLFQLGIFHCTAVLKHSFKLSVSFMLAETTNYLNLLITYIFPIHFLGILLKCVQA